MDMAGNVWEWMESFYQEGGVSRVVRGSIFLSTWLARAGTATSPTTAAIISSFRASELSTLRGKNPALRGFCLEIF